ncbi:2-dehydropantoate 2-reductase N-terminal domain-containing protein [soil metagenome]
MRYVIIGAGAVGGTIGARLAQSGHEVLLVARGSHLEQLKSGGLRLITATGTSTQAIPAVAGPAEAGELRPDDVLILTVKSQDTIAALTRWAAAPVAGGGAAGDLLPVVCAQNGVENERVAQRLFRTVYALCVWLPATHIEPGVVISHTAPLSGILTVGRYSQGVDSVAEEIGAALRRSVFDAPVVADVMRWKYGKLLMNLGNAVDAILDKEDSGAAQLTAEMRAACQAEGESALAAAGIAYNTDEERRALQGDRMDMQAIEGVGRGGGSTWQSLARGAGTVEADYLNGEIALLGRLHGVPTPVNDLLQRLVAEFARERRAPGGLSPDQLRTLLH